MRSGAAMFVDVVVRVPPDLNMRDAVVMEEQIREALVKVRKDVYEVRVKFVPDVEREKANGVGEHREESNGYIGGLKEDDGRKQNTHSH